MTGFSNPFGGLGGQPASKTNGGAGHAHVKDTTTQAFGRDVMEESTRQPVLVDFWAPWCGPCRQLTPVIEKVVAEAGGKVKLVKLNIDDHPAIPGQLGIQSIPAVVAFVNGRPVDGFMGALPETQVRAFIDKIAGPGAGPIDEAAEIEAVLTEAEAALAEGDLGGAADMFGAVLQADPDSLRALAGMANCMIAAGQWERARDLLASLPDDKKTDAVVAPLLAKLAQIEEARKLGDPRALEHELALNPDHHDARMKLAKILNVEGDREGAAEHLFYIMKKDRAYDDDGARRQLLQFFDVWGVKDPATIAARRKLSSILFS
ncbi:putative thioredoxin [Rhizobium sp. SG_E_25_P2]|jgi:putative thioredoxin|uniref:thioredoxin n=1 Tax=Rhizobium sp. SG_E_25_P2 TaxID=2879942 RepID=UPI00247552CA|nr:thioredoxin [Rhizobium sp. SG_E_25_P2]MDH6269791.1 putative thioredoxin [Rhizobium sp. SG_E_25_P2]